MNISIEWRGNASHALKDRAPTIDRMGCKWTMGDSNYEEMGTRLMIIGNEPTDFNRGRRQDCILGNLLNRVEYPFGGRPALGRGPDGHIRDSIHFNPKNDDAPKRVGKRGHRPFELVG